MPPAQAAVSRGTFWAIHWEKRLGATAHAGPLAGRVVPVASCNSSNLLPPRWHLAHGAVWVSGGVSGIRVGKPPEWVLAYCQDQFTRYEAADLARGKIVPAPGAAPVDITDPGDDSTNVHFGDETPLDWARYHYGTRAPGYFTLHADALPVGPAEVRQFILSDVISQTKDLEGVRPVLKMTVYSYKGRWDVKTKGWVATSAKWSDDSRWWEAGPFDGWVREEEIEVGFRGAFRVMASGKDYYFLTDGGSLFRSPPATKKGTPRPIRRVYDGRDRPVLATVTDVDAGRTFLFVESAKGPAFFELSDRPEQVVYDPKVAAVPEGDGPLRSILHKARVLAKLGRIKGK
ncbi:MAG: hypothetical protein ACRC33_13700 [Gemmataceae bacterium]